MSTQSNRNTMSDDEGEVAVIKIYNLGKGAKKYDTFKGPRTGTEYLFDNATDEYVGLYTPSTKKLDTTVPDPTLDNEHTTPPPKKTRGPWSAETKAKAAATRASNKAKKQAEAPSTTMLELMSVLTPTTAPPPKRSLPVPWDMNIRTLSSGIISLPEVTCWKPGTDSIQFGSHMAAFGYKRNPEDGLYYRT